jgi:hypothetical protein
MNPSLIAKAESDNVAFAYDWQTDMTRLGATAIEEHDWLVVAGSIALNADGRANAIVNDSVAVTYVSGGLKWELNQLACTVQFDTGDVLTRTFTLAVRAGNQPTPAAPGTLANPLGEII